MYACIHACVSNVYVCIGACDTMYNAFYQCGIEYTVYLYMYKYLCCILLGITFQQWNEIKQDRIEKKTSKQTMTGKSSLSIHGQTIAHSHTPFVFRFVNAFYIFRCLHMCSPPILCVQCTHIRIVYDKFIFCILLVPFVIVVRFFVFFF